MSEEHWYHAKEGVAVGPLTAPQLAELVRAGKVPTGTLIWTPEMESWEPVEKVQPDWLKPAAAKATAPKVAAPSKTTAPVLVADKATTEVKLASLVSQPKTPPAAGKPQETAEKKGGLWGKIFKR